ncbi:MAG: hypothetical protein BWY47_02143 [Bacteroidetes bacterium ADurb.Bin302]|nr:MAG: hypothetical protein BWY47_02143 [Bacteroidetes bacterium ADurb.Bin302]
MYKIGDLIYLANAESGPMVEHLVRIDGISGDGIINSSKVVSVHKMPQQNGGLGYIPMPGFGLISNNPTLQNGNPGVLYINLSNFDMHGKVTDPEMIKVFDNFSTKLVLPEIGKKGLIA